MQKLRVESFSISIDGCGACPIQSLDNPLGAGGEDLHKWLIPTQTFQQMGNENGTAGVDNDYASRGFENIGAWIKGRNMFGPVRGPWPDEEWKGWWGENPPYYVPVYVLTHHKRDPVEMEDERLFSKIELIDLGYRCTENVATDLTTHVIIKKDKYENKRDSNAKNREPERMAGSTENTS